MPRTVHVERTNEVHHYMEDEGFYMWEKNIS